MNPRKIVAIAVALTKSQLRASRTSSFANLSFFRRPTILFIIDAVLFLVAGAMGYAIVTFIGAGSNALTSQATTYLKEVMVFVPALIPGVVFIAGVLFELSVSSKFSASDIVNWLPIEQSDYVMGSALSVSYDYSVTAAFMLGITVVPAIALGLWAAWIAMALLSLVSLFIGGVLVEIVRAGVNRVSSAVMGRARRGAVVLRLVITVGIIVILELVFNPSILITRLPDFSSGLSAYALIPLFWASFAVEGIVIGQPLYVLGFTVLTLALAGLLVRAAVSVRSKYWSPVPTTVKITTSEYAPRSSFLSRLGLSDEEAALVKKDLKGATRRRELLTFFSVPIVLVVVFSLDIFLVPGSSVSGSQGLGFLGDIPVIFVGGLFGVMISSISFGQESKAVMVLYSLPVSAQSLLKAKGFFALSFALLATVASGIYFGVIAHASLNTVLENLVIGVTISVEGVCVGLAFGAAYPDFQERPRPRYVDPFWQIVMLIVALPLLGVTAAPLFVRDVVGTVPGLQFPTLELFPVAMLFAVVISILFYRWAQRSVVRLMAEYRI